jgi:hypothetical protein
MTTISLAFPILYHLAVLGLCAYLFMRGFTHVFLYLFAGGALLEVLRSGAFLAMNFAPGGLSANVHYFPIISAIGFLGMIVFLAGFVSLTMYLLRPATSTV